MEWRKCMKRIGELEQSGISIREQLECPELARLDIDLRHMDRMMLGTLIGLVEAIDDDG